MSDRKRQMVQAAAVKWPRNPREGFQGIEALAENLGRIGQQVPIIVVAEGDGLIGVDGERRCRAAIHAGIRELEALVLDAVPPPATLHLLQLSLDVHRQSLSPMERSNAVAAYQKECGFGVVELANALSMPQPVVSKLLAFQRLHADLKRLLHEGRLDMERAYIVAGVDDVAKQRELVEQACGLSREQLRAKARPRAQAVEPKASNARFVMPGGFVIGVQGKDVTLTVAIEVLTETVRLLKKGQKDGLDITTQQRVMRDTSKSKKEVQS